MTVDQFVAVMGAFTALIGALGVIYVQLLQNHRAVNGRMTELLEMTRQAAQTKGELAGRDFVAGVQLERPAEAERVPPEQN